MFCVKTIFLLALKGGSSMQLITFISISTVMGLLSGDDGLQTVAPSLKVSKYGFTAGIRAY